MAVFEDNWNYRIDQCNTEKSSNEFDLRVSCLREDLLNLNGFKLQNYKCDNTQSPDDELKNLIEKNKQLRQDIETKLEDLSKQKKQYEKFKEDQKLLSQEIKDTHEAFLMAKKYYKKFLKMYYTIEARNGEKQTIFLQFFTETKKESENYSVRMVRNTKTGSYELLETKPKLKTFEELKKAFEGTNDLPSIICSIRQDFMQMKNTKNS